MNTVILIIFVASYLGIAFGSLPHLALDRTGFALLGAITMLSTGALGLPAALHSIDTATILLLYALMVISAQLRLGGFYTWSALRLTAHLSRPVLFLALLMAVTAGLSAVLTNDIVCLAFTPIVCVALLRAGLNPAPFLLGLAASSNIGSAATIIGNPQNMLIGQVQQLDFGRFLAFCLPPSLISLAAAFGILCLLYRGRWRLERAEGCEAAADWPPFNRWQTGKGLIVIAAVVAMFFTSVPREVSALTAAGLLLLSRHTKSRSLLSQVDWHLITLFCGLFIVVKGLEVTGLPGLAVDRMRQYGLDLHNLFALTGLSAALSNVVSNVPATMLLIKFVDPSRPAESYVLALASTFAGNLVTLGSIANLIVIEQAKQFGIELSFREHARSGIWITLVSLAVVALWVRLVV
jgi:Na+/H+ antiporter NhaD/arsenite permease-like protein